MRFIKKSLPLATAFCSTSFLVTSVLGATVAQAEQTQGVTITPMVGWFGADTSRNIDDNEFASLGLGYQYNGPWAAELTYLKTKSADGAFNDIELEQLRLDALYYLNATNNLTPYFVFGLGQTSYDKDQFEDDELVNGGFGLKYAFSDNLALRSEVRLMHGFDDSHTDVTAGLGLQYTFGSKAAPVKETQPKDSDNDGVLDATDACPNTPAGTTVDASGCPVKLDDDNDGVLNDMDECPDTEAGAKVDDKGCYIIIKEDVKVELNVQFENNSNIVQENTKAKIAEVATFMTEFPLTHVVVQGHTDSRGSAAYNMKLSEQRAAAVAGVLINEFGIDAARVSSKGFGEESPIATNDTAEGRAQNRRVEAVVSATVEKKAQ